MMDRRSGGSIQEGCVLWRMGFYVNEYGDRRWRSDPGKVDRRSNPVRMDRRSDHGPKTLKERKDIGPAQPKVINEDVFSDHVIWYLRLGNGLAC